MKAKATSVVRPLMKLASQRFYSRLDIMTGAERSYTRIPFEPSNNDKFFINEITGTKTDKVRTYRALPEKLH